MKTIDSLYIRILIWAFEKPNGFTEQELFDEFNLTQGTTEYRLYLKLFRDGNSSTGNPSTIDYFETRESKAYFTLTDKGMASAIDYLDLKEARESSREAKRVALWSIWIAVIVGIFQILTSFCSF